jgi:formylglycine-generating enzyme required for sulfatase activity
LVTGRKPYSADTPAAIMLKQANDPLPRPRQFAPDLPEDLEKVLFKALAKKPEDRYQSMSEFAAALEKLILGQTSLAIGELAERRVEEEQTLLPVGRGQKAPEAVQKVPTQPEVGKMSGKWGRWAAIGGLVIVVALGVVFGNSLLNRGQKTPGPLAGLATPTAADTTARVPTQTPMPTTVSTWTRPADGMVMVPVPAGTFSMGSNNGDSNQQPVHNVTLDAYWIDSTEVTNDMYGMCVSAGTCQPPTSPSSTIRDSYYGNSTYDNYPVIFVSWNDAQSYCEWAGARLPTEAEWEKTARGMDGRIYPWGNDSPSKSFLNFNNDIGDTNAVGRYSSGVSPYGALDMGGNVMEWVNDWYNAKYYQNSPSSNPTGPASGKSRVLRGGSWADNELSVRSTSRNWLEWFYLNPSVSYSNIGFRCARSSP